MKNAHNVCFEGVYYYTTSVAEPEPPLQGGAGADFFLSRSCLF